MFASTANDSSISFPEIINHDTPYAYLLPQLARDFALEVYIVFALVGVFALDFLSTVHHEIYIISRRRLQWPLATHYVSRLSTMALVISVAIEKAAPISNCKDMVIVLSVLLVLSAASTSLQYFLRVRAVVSHWRCMTIVLFILWLAICGSCAAIPFAVSPHTIGPTNFCIPLLDQQWDSLWFIITWAVFDTLTFLVVSYDILVNMNTRFGSQTPWYKQPLSSLTGRYLPRLAKSFLRRGTKYYFSAFALDIAVLVISVTRARDLPGQPLTLSLVFSDVCSKNMLICRLYRVTIVDGLEVNAQRVSLDPVTFTRSSHPSNPMEVKECLPRSECLPPAPLEVHLDERAATV